MSIAIPEKILRRILSDLKAALKSEKTDFLQRQSMVDGLDLFEGRMNPWFIHQRNVRKLKAGSLTRLVTTNVTLSRGRYRKFEWYEGKHFLSLAFRWGKEQPEPEIGLQIQEVDTLSSQFLVYQGALGYDDLVESAKKKGIRGLKNSKTTDEWTVD